jgi:hypothetical protein
MVTRRAYATRLRGQLSATLGLTIRAVRVFGPLANTQLGKHEKTEAKAHRKAYRCS